MLTTAQKAPLLDEDGTQLTTATASVVGTNDNVYRVQPDQDGNIFIAGHGPGTATLNATRTSDGAIASMEVVVEPEPFSISLGAPVPK